MDSDLLTTLAKVVDQNKVQIVSNSWGDLEANESTDNIAAYQEIFIQGAMQGISFMFSSGDNGDELANTGLKQADYPASDPYITSVGGTSDAIGIDGTFKFQTGWGTQKYKLNATQTAASCMEPVAEGRRCSTSPPIRMGLFRRAWVTSGQSRTWPWMRTPPLAC